MEILEKLSLAASRVAEHYFALPVAGCEKPLLREHVYCYELYHQLRCILPNNTRLVLTAEPEKRSNPSFTQGHPIPDFIFHEPGSHVQNRAVIEVECRVNRCHLKKDLRTLRCLQEKGYQPFILLLFGVRMVLWNTLLQVAHEVGMKLDQISVLLHSEAGSKASFQELPTGTVPEKSRAK